jgi:hypothetical protein
MIWVRTKVHMAKDKVVLILAVGEKNPGTNPKRLETKMNRKMVAINGKNALPSGPVISTIKSSRPPTTISKIF